MLLILLSGRLYALQRGMELDKSSPEARTFLLALMDIAEKVECLLNKAIYMLICQCKLLVIIAVSS